MKVSIHKRPEFGHTWTFGDGRFHIALNGIGPIVLSFEKDGYLPVQRHLVVNWQDWTAIEEVAMLQHDTRVTHVQLGEGMGVQVARGSPPQDADGPRQATILFPRGVTARAILPDRSEVSLAELSIRATEYTVGEEGPSAMPGELPPQIAYTYAVALSVSADEAVALGTKELRFSQPVSFYLENFIGYPVGGIVPAGYYDRNVAAWISSDNGLVIRIVGIADDRALVDVDGDGEADSEDALDDPCEDEGSIIKYENQIPSGTFAEVETESRYTELGEMASVASRVSGATLWDVEYGYGEDGRIVERRERHGGGAPSVIHYGYDPMGRLVSVSVDGAVTDSYTYDPNGNRLSVNGSPAWVYDAQDRLLTAYLPAGTVDFTYSPSGSLESRQDASGFTQYDYDAVGNLCTVSLPDGRVVEYLIDPRDRRVGKRVDGLLQQAFLYDGQLRAAACVVSDDCSGGFQCSATGFSQNADGETELHSGVRSQFIYALRSHVHDLMSKDGVLYRLLSDHLGSIHYVVEAETGTIIQALRYDAWGRILHDTNPGFQPFGFAGGLYDPDTGLYRFGARDYDPTTGRWTAKDPILFHWNVINLPSFDRWP